jgi:hypothetical protein
LAILFSKMKIVLLYFRYRSFVKKSFRGLFHGLREWVSTFLFAVENDLDLPLTPPAQMARVIHAPSLDSRETDATTRLAAAQWDIAAQEAWKKTHADCWHIDGHGILWALMPRAFPAMDCVGYANTKGSSFVSYRSV